MRLSLPIDSTARNIGAYTHLEYVPVVSDDNAVPRIVTAVINNVAQNTQLIVCGSGITQPEPGTINIPKDCHFFPNGSQTIAHAIGPDKITGLRTTQEVVCLLETTNKRGRKFLRNLTGPGPESIILTHQLNLGVHQYFMAGASENPFAKLGLKIRLWPEIIYKLVSQDYPAVKPGQERAAIKFPFTFDFNIKPTEHARDYEVVGEQQRRIIRSLIRRSILNSNGQRTSLDEEHCKAVCSGVFIATAKKKLYLVSDRVHRKTVPIIREYVNNINHLGARLLRRCLQTADAKR